MPAGVPQDSYVRSADFLPKQKGLMVKTTGVADVLRAAPAPLAAQIRVAFIYWVCRQACAEKW
jgi:hypothetical protein